MKVCKGYVGIACVDGNCPIALHDEYEERGMDCVRSCEECIFYKGCEDCAFYGTQHCILSLCAELANFKKNRLSTT